MTLVLAQYVCMYKMTRVCLIPATCVPPQCLKLSPNLRRQSKEVKAALLNKDLKKAGEMEIKKLDQLLGQVCIKYMYGAVQVQILPYRPTPYRYR